MARSLGLKQIFSIKERKSRRAARQAASRIAAGAMSRENYLEANRVSRTQPWVDQGISRATWYRRQKAAAAGENTGKSGANPDETGLCLLQGGYTQRPAQAKSPKSILSTPHQRPPQPPQAPPTSPESREYPCIIPKIGFTSLSESAAPRTRSFAPALAFKGSPVRWTGRGLTFPRSALPPGLDVDLNFPYGFKKSIPWGRSSNGIT